MGRSRVKRSGLGRKVVLADGPDIDDGYSPRREEHEVCGDLLVPSRGHNPDERNGTPNHPFLQANLG